MVVDQKIKEAEYFLDKIQKVDRDEIDPNFNAFLSTTRSIADYLLEDYNQKYGLDISPYDNIHKFGKIAREKNNYDAVKFIACYNHRFEKLHDDKIIHFLIQNRNVTTHRESVHLQKNVSISIRENVNANTSISNTTLKWSFYDDDFKQFDVVESCQKFLETMKEFVKKLRTDFP